MKKIFLIFLVFFCGIISFGIKGKATSISTQYIHAEYNKNYDETNILDEFDYCFKGRVSSYIQTSQYNGNGSDIPYSFFNVDVTHNIKGNTENSIIIKFYGGYTEDNTLVLLEGMSYPEIGEEYMFYCDQTRYTFEEDNRTLDFSYVVSMKENMQKASYETQNNISEEALKKTESNIMPYRAPSPNYDLIKDDNAGTADNYTFEKAYTIDLEEQKSVAINDKGARYYKFTAPSLEYYAVYSTTANSRPNDPVVEVYNSNYQLIGYNHNVYENDHGIYTTTGDNFFQQFYAEKNQTIYFKVDIADDEGSFYLHVKIDNNHLSNILDLMNDSNCVDGKRKVDYKIKSKYIEEINYGINEWNKLESIRFVPDSSGTINDITISDFYDNDTKTVAETNYIFDTVKYNDYYFGRMTKEQRIKTVLHEFGHVLGLEEFTKIETDVNVMHQGIRSITRLGPADIAAYRAKWDLRYD